MPTKLTGLSTKIDIVLTKCVALPTKLRVLLTKLVISSRLTGFSPKSTFLDNFIQWKGQVYHPKYSTVFRCLLDVPWESNPHPCHFFYFVHHQLLLEKSDHWWWGQPLVNVTEQLSKQYKNTMKEGTLKNQQKKSQSMWLKED